jgi:hypothetical protein
MGEVLANPIPIYEMATHRVVWKKKHGGPRKDFCHGFES